MTHVTYRLTTKNRDQLRNPTFGNRVLATFTFLLLIIYVISEKIICNPLSHPTWKCTTLTCEVPNFFLSDWRFALYLHFSYLPFPSLQIRTCVFRFPPLRNALFRTCLLRTCVFQYLRFQRPPRRVCESCQPMEQWRCTKRSTSGRSEQSDAGTCYGGVLVASRYFLSR